MFALQSSGLSGEWSQTGQTFGRFLWPMVEKNMSDKMIQSITQEVDYLQLSQIDCSQHGRREAPRASSLQMVHRSLTGISGNGIGLFTVRGGVSLVDFFCKKLHVYVGASHLKPFADCSCVVAISELATRALGGEYKEDAVGREGRPG